MQFLGWFYTPVVVQWQARLVQTAQSGGAAGAIPAVVGVAVLMQRQGGVLLHSGSASDSSRRLRTFLLRQRRCRTVQTVHFAVGQA